jgi:hypothetical protein
MNVSLVMLVALAGGCVDQLGESEQMITPTNPPDTPPPPCGDVIFFGTVKSTTVDLNQQILFIAFKSDPVATGGTDGAGNTVYYPAWFNNPWIGTYTKPGGYYAFQDTYCHPFATISVRLISVGFGDNTLACNPTTDTTTTDKTGGGILIINPTCELAKKPLPTDP